MLSPINYCAQKNPKTKLKTVSSERHFILSKRISHLGEEHKKPVVASPQLPLVLGASHIGPALKNSTTRIHRRGVFVFVWTEAVRDRPSKHIGDFTVVFSAQGCGALRCFAFGFAGLKPLLALKLMLSQD